MGLGGRLYPCGVRYADGGGGLTPVGRVPHVPALDARINHPLLWGMRYLPLGSAAYRIHLLRWFQVMLSTTVLGWLVLVEPLKYHNVPDTSFLLAFRGRVLRGWPRPWRTRGPGSEQRGRSGSADPAP